MDMNLETIKTPGLAHLSYFLASNGEAAVVDPRRDIDIYLNHARAHGATIKYIFETHRNEDLISGAPLLAKATGATVWHGPKPAEPIAYAASTGEGEEFHLGEAKISVLETPGHTDDSLSFVLHDQSFDTGPIAVFTGDALFVGDVGRTDFYPQRKREVAGLLFDSLQKLLALGDQCLIYPAHGAGSVCGAGMADREFSSIGHERVNNPRLKITDRESFIDAKIAEHHYVPPYFKHMERCNAEGTSPPPAAPLPLPAGALLDPADRLCLDVRGIFDFAGGHHPNTLCIPHDMLASFAGWFLDAQTPILLIARDWRQAVEASATLARIGIDKVDGYVAGVMPLAVQNADIHALPFINTQTLKQRLEAATNAWTLLDVRSIEEFEANHIDGAQHAYVGALPTAADDIAKSQAVTVMCGSGARATIAASQLLRAGWKEVDVYIGSMKAWTAAGQSTTT
ncbi:MAG: rhodanese-like domain-containing protein [Sphingomonadales bacterium]